MCKAQDQYTHDAVERLLEDKDPVIMVTKHYDSTPQRVGFGRYQEIIAPHARYLWFDTDKDRWLNLTMQQYQKCNPRRRNFRYGTIALFSQGVALHQVDDEGLYKAHKMFCPPRVLQASNASCTFAATEAEVPDLSIDGLRRLRLKYRYMLMN